MQKELSVGQFFFSFASGEEAHEVESVLRFFYKKTK